MPRTRFSALFAAISATRISLGRRATGSPSIEHMFDTRRAPTSAGSDRQGWWPEWPEEILRHWTNVLKTDFARGRDDVAAARSIGRPVHAERLGHGAGTAR